MAEEYKESTIKFMASCDVTLTPETNEQRLKQLADGAIHEVSLDGIGDGAIYYYQYSSVHAARPGPAPIKLTIPESSKETVKCSRCGRKTTLHARGNCGVVCQDCYDDE